MTKHLTKKTILSITEMPEIMVFLTCFLTTRDIAKCILTCKALHRAIKPFLWEYISPMTCFNRSFTIRQNLHLIRFININTRQFELIEMLNKGLLSEDPGLNTDNSAMEKTSTHCKNLVYLLLPEESNGRYYLKELTTLLQYNSTLTALEFSIGRSEQYFDSPSFLKIIPSLRQLKYFKCHASYISYDLTISILLATLSLPRLSEIYYNMLVFINDDDIITKDVETVIKEAMEARKLSGGQTKTRIKSLQIPEATSVSTFFVPFLKSGLLDLDTFEIPWSESLFYAEHLALIREHCPNISKLTYLESQHYTHQRGYMAYSESNIMNNANTFIQGCNSLKSVLFRGQRLNRAPVETEKMLLRLTELHANSLESFIFTHHEIYNNYTALQAALSPLFRCKNLERFWVSSPTSHAFLVKDMIAEEWLCHGLRELHLYLHQGSQFTRNRTKKMCVTVDSVSLRELFKRVNNLRNLEILGLQQDSWEISSGSEEKWNQALSENFLTLTNMKKLQHFYMANNFSSWMGQEHVEFIYNNWPTLQSISFSVRPYIYGWLERSYIGKSHWNWLRERRSNLEFREA